MTSRDDVTSGQSQRCNCEPIVSISSPYSNQSQSRVSQVTGSDVIATVYTIYSTTLPVRLDPLLAVQNSPAYTRVTRDSSACVKAPGRSSVGNTALSKHHVDRQNMFASLLLNSYDHHGTRPTTTTILWQGRHTVW